MTLQEHLRALKDSKKVSLCNASDSHQERGGVVYDAFYIGEAKEVPTDALQRTVTKDYISLMWNTHTFILE